MKATSQVARTEILEQWRQPWMLFILILNYALWLVGFFALFLILDRIAHVPEKFAQLKQQMALFGVGFDAFLKLAISSYGSLMFTNLPLFVAIMAGTSVLHDRDCGTMPFLMLAPITRRQLLLGKLAGTMTLPLLFHVVLVGSGGLLMGHLGLLAPYAKQFGASTAWWLAFLIGTPAAAAFVGTLGTVISALARDTRTSMQYTSFFIGLLSLGFGFALVDGISWGAGLQIAFALGCVLATGLTLFVGVQLLSKDFASS